MTSSLAAQHIEISPASPLALDECHNVLDVNAAGDELHAGSAHHAKRLFTLVVNERYVAEVHDAFARVAPVVRVPPTAFEFRNPRGDEAALQSPTLFSGAVVDGDPQHCVFSRHVRSAHAMPTRDEVVLDPETLSATGDRRNGANVSAAGANVPGAAAAAHC